MSKAQTGARTHTQVSVVGKMVCQDDGCARCAPDCVGMTILWFEEIELWPRFRRCFYIER